MAAPKTRWLLLAVPDVYDGDAGSEFAGTTWGNAECAYVFESLDEAKAVRAQIAKRTHKDFWSVTDSDIKAAATPKGKEVNDVVVMICPVTYVAAATDLHTSS